MDMHAACVHCIFLWSHIGNLQGSQGQEGHWLSSPPPGYPIFCCTLLTCTGYCTAAAYQTLPCLCKHCLVVCIVSEGLFQSGLCVALITDNWSLVLSFKCCWICMHTLGQKCFMAAHDRIKKACFKCQTNATHAWLGRYSKQFICVHIES